MVEDFVIWEKVRLLRAEMPGLGSRKLYHLLADALRGEGIQIGRDRFHEVLRRGKLLIRRHKRRARTTYSDHFLPKYPNLIRRPRLTGPNRLWLSDITYVRVGDDFAFLSLITDGYSHKIVGHHLHHSLEAQGSIVALEQALAGEADRRGMLIHHSDRGIQYCSSDYVKILNTNNIEISMSEHPDPRENAIAERVNGIIKNEMLEGQSFTDIEEARREIGHAVAVYNNKRPHLSCNMLTPDQAHGKLGKLRKHWKNYYKKRVETRITGPTPGPTAVISRSNTPSSSSFVFEKEKNEK